MHFIPDMMSLQNNNDYGLNSQVHPRTFSIDYHKKEEEDTSRKRDLLEEILQLWHPKIKQIKEILEIRNLFSQIQYASSQQQQPIIGSIPGGFSLPSSIDDLTSSSPPPPSPPMTFTPETDPLKDRIIGYTGFVCETCSKRPTCNISL
jgi:hypothetical protein